MSERKRRNDAGQHRPWRTASGALPSSLPKVPPSRWARLKVFKGWENNPSKILEAALVQEAWGTLVNNTGDPKAGYRRWSVYLGRLRNGRIVARTLASAAVNPAEFWNLSMERHGGDLLETFVWLAHQVKVAGLP